MPYLLYPLQGEFHLLGCGLLFSSIDDDFVLATMFLGLLLLAVTQASNYFRLGFFALNWGTAYVMGSFYHLTGRAIKANMLNLLSVQQRFFRLKFLDFSEMVFLLT